MLELKEAKTVIKNLFLENKDLKNTVKELQEQVKQLEYDLHFGGKNKVKKLVLVKND